MAYPEYFIACAACGCHARAHENDCPHCRARLRRPDGNFHRTSAAIALGLSAATVTTSQLVACSAYGVSCSFGDSCHDRTYWDGIEDDPKDAGKDTDSVDFIPKSSTSTGSTSTGSTGQGGGAGGQGGTATAGQGGAAGAGGQDGGDMAGSGGGGGAAGGGDAAGGAGGG